jgi:trimethylamine monooxygenase
MPNTMSWTNIFGHFPHVLLPSNSRLFLQFYSYRNTVLSISRAPDWDATGCWTVRWLDELGEEREEQFEAVLLAQGHHAKPKMAQFPGQHQFQGRILHSHDFKDSREFDDQAIRESSF